MTTKVVFGRAGTAVMALAVAASIVSSCSSSAPAPTSPPPPSPSPSPTPVPTPSPTTVTTPTAVVTPAGSPSLGLTERFTSAINGISLSYPTGWHSRVATEPWTGEPPLFDEPFVDVIFDPALTDHLFVLVTSMMLDGSGEAFVEEFSSGFGYDPASCPADDANLSVDEAVGRLVTRCPETGEYIAVVATGDRGYVIVSYGVENVDWFRSILATVEFGGLATSFERPFSYALLPGTSITDQSRTRYAFSQGTSSAYPMADWRPFPGAHGITVSYGTEIRTHGSSYAMRRLRPTDFLADLRVNTMLTVGPITITSLAGLPATQADVRFNGDIGASSGYPHIDIGVERIIDLQFPSRMFVADVGGGVIVVQIWAGTEEELVAWLPQGVEFVESLEFV